MRVPFFRTRIFDGTWNFDGSVLMDGKKRYNLHVGLKYDEGGTVTDEAVRKPRVRVKSTWNIKEKADSVRAGFCFGINFLRSKQKNISRMSTKMYLAIDNQREKADVISVTVTKKDTWFFDGSVLMDGTRYFNSIYGKEIL